MPRRGKKSIAPTKENEENEEGQLSRASSISNMDDTQPYSDSERNEDISKIGKRVEEAEERINGAETRIQSSEDVLTELVKLQMQTEAKLTDLEGRSRRENVRIHGVKEGAEEGTASVIAFVEDLLTKSLELPSSTALNIERAHRALAPKPPNEAPPRSIVVKFSSYTVKEDVLKRAWQKKGFDYQGKRIQLDHDYAPEVLRKRREYAEAKAARKGRNLRFQTPFPARLRVFYEEGTVRGIPVTVVKKTTSLLDQISRMTWRSSEKRGNRDTTRENQGFKERLHAYHCQDT
ncbi:LINE-1 retrotransposable element ORF1 protein [Dissostichus eleginoides]|uniref:LINE-1 retrotransposable element ORF1 protein n=1 Tax=Dissostichus eleginoides TaxID=100907 RepID=A0AAD9CPW2_DISEL|nr:LINE-1 retrotransposable element ORF1 protein [Dissostichus eleginoides]